MQLKILSNFANQRVIALMLFALGVTGATTYYTLNQLGSGSKPETIAQVQPTVQKVAALGRLEPESEIVRLAAPVTLSGDRVAQLLVKEGDRIQKGQVVAVLDSRDRLAAAVQQAEEEVQIAQSKLAQVRAGAKTGEIQAQQATITRLQAELSGANRERAAAVNRLESEVRIAKAEFDRYLQLYKEGAISTSSLDNKRLTYETAQAQLTEAQASRNRTEDTVRAQIQEARATLDQIAEVRPVDVQVAQADVQNAIAALKRAQAELEEAYVRAPMTGQIIKIHTRPGEKLGDEGIADIGQTDQMVAIAEVYQSDIGKVKLGQAATVTGQAFDKTLTGKVIQIDRQVSRQSVFSSEPGENLDRRVVEVKVRLTPESSQQVAALTNLQVQVEIQP